MGRTFGALPVHEALLEESISRDFTGWPQQFVQNGVAGAEDWQQVGGALPDSAQPPVTLRERAGGRASERASAARPAPSREHQSNAQAGL